MDQFTVLSPGMASEQGTFEGAGHRTWSFTGRVAQLVPLPVSHPIASPFSAAKLPGVRPCTLTLMQTHTHTHTLRTHARKARKLSSTQVIGIQTPVIFQFFLTVTRLSHLVPPLVMENLGGGVVGQGLGHQFHRIPHTLTKCVPISVQSGHMIPITYALILRL